MDTISRLSNTMNEINGKQNEHPTYKLNRPSPASQIVVIAIQILQSVLGKRHYSVCLSESTF